MPNNTFTNPVIIRTNPTIGRRSQFTPYLEQLERPPRAADFIVTSRENPTVDETAKSDSQFTVYSEDAAIWKASAAKSTNISATSAAKAGVGVAVNIAGAVTGIPQVVQVGDSLLGQSTQTLSSTYSTLDYNQLKPVPGVKYADFRSRRILTNSQQNSGGLTKIRLDGASAALRGSVKAGIYAAATANPLGGAYAVFNLDGVGNSGYGWGDHDNPYALRLDFTARSHVATKWDYDSEQWIPTKNPLEFITPFRGDRVNVIDFGTRNLSTAYKWRPTAKKDNEKNNKLLDKLGLTQDFIKFFFTGPKLFNGAENFPDIEDDVMVFRAIIGSLSDSFSPNWTSVPMIGRADPNYHYTGVTRELSLDFTVYATDRDELKPIWRKLNALAGYTAPKYSANDITLGAPWMRITIGDIYRQQPVILTSLSYTLVDADTTWEINIEDDPAMMQVPHKVSVSCGFNMISDFLPQRNGRFFSLAKQYTANTGSSVAVPITGNDNWLSDFEGNEAGQKRPKTFRARQQDEPQTQS